MYILTTKMYWMTKEYVCMMYVCIGGCMKEKYMGGFSAKDKVSYI